MQRVQSAASPKGALFFSAPVWSQSIRASRPSSVSVKFFAGCIVICVIVYLPADVAVCGRCADALSLMKPGWGPARQVVAAARQLLMAPNHETIEVGQPLRAAAAAPQVRTPTYPHSLK